MVRTRVLGEPEEEGNSTILRREGGNLEKASLHLGLEGSTQLRQHEMCREGFSGRREQHKPRRRGKPRQGTVGTGQAAWQGSLPVLCGSQGTFCPESALRPGISGIFWEGRGVADPYPLLWFHEVEGKAWQPWAPDAGLDIVEAQRALFLSDLRGGVHCSLGRCGWTGSWPFLPVSQRMASV